MIHLVDCCARCYVKTPLRMMERLNPAWVLRATAPLCSDAEGAGGRKREGVSDGQCCVCFRRRARVVRLAIDLQAIDWVVVKNKTLDCVVSVFSFRNNFLRSEIDTFLKCQLSGNGPISGIFGCCQKMRLTYIQGDDKYAAMFLHHEIACPGCWCTLAG